MLFAEEAGPPCPFIITGVERPLEIVLSTSIIVLLMLQEESSCLLQTLFVPLTFMALHQIHLGQKGYLTRLFITVHHLEQSI